MRALFRNTGNRALRGFGGFALLPMESVKPQTPYMTGGSTYIRLGRPEAARQVLFITAPLLVAAALSLAGVVGGADDKFRWPGVILLTLVATAMLLLASIQLGHYAFQFWFTRGELAEKLPRHSDEQREERFTAARGYFEKRLTIALYCFHVGTLMLGVGVASALFPPDGGMQASWRTAAAVLVLVCTVLDGLWFLSLSTSNPR
ncbi:hypothetical protein ACVNF4_25805 [Streptomyces sp. S6]